RIDVGLGQRRAGPQPATPLSWEAYSAYLKGRHLLLDNKTEATIAVALQYFQRAIELDPSFALAYAGLADAYAERADADLDPKKAYELSREAAMRALSINPDLAEAHVSMANELFYGEWKWAGADREYKRALELKPTYEEAHHSYSHYRSEEHTSELQSRGHLVCRLLLEKKKQPTLTSPLLSLRSFSDANRRSAHERRKSTLYASPVMSFAPLITL